MFLRDPELQRAAASAAEAFATENPNMSGTATATPVAIPAMRVLNFTTYSFVFLGSTGGTYPGRSQSAT